MRVEITYFQKLTLVAVFLAMVVGFIYTVLLAADSICPKEEDVAEAQKGTVRRCSI